MGGGPSAPSDLERIPGCENMICVSANAHAFKLPKLKPTLIVSNDHVHTMTRELMAPMLRQFGVPIVTKHWWAHYRLADWLSRGNSGMNAIAVAALMGGHPVIAVGIDCFAGQTYFHSPGETNVSLGRPAGYWQNRLRRMQERMRGAQIRAVSGPLVRLCGEYQPDEVLPPFRMSVSFSGYAEPGTYHVRTRSAFSHAQDARVEIPKGVLVAVSAYEYWHWIRMGLADGVGEAPEEAPMTEYQRIRKVLEAAREVVDAPPRL